MCRNFEETPIRIGESLERLPQSKTEAEKAGRFVEVTKTAAQSV
jgi:hypothetical protein